MRVIEIETAKEKSLSMAEQKENYSVAVSYGNDLGWIEYDDSAKKILVHLANEEGKKKAEDFLSQKLTLKVPHETLMDFTEETIDPAASRRNFELALSRLWEKTQVHVDWSRPVEYVRQHPRYEE